MSDRIFGAIPGIYEGQTFANRIELSLSLVHRPRQAGISGSQNEGADSIVLSGGYEDDEDHGDVIIYTGHGGRDNKSGKQVTDQDLIRQNQALALNCQRGLPVRVIRGSNSESDYAPAEGYRYDGLYRVTEYWRKKGKRGYQVWLFRLEKIHNPYLHNEELIDELHDSGSAEEAALRKETVIQRIIRDTELSRRVKMLYQYSCQVCGIQLTTNAGPYAEAAHIRPLGYPHNGPDRLDNLLCLCPNHHVQFDYGGFAVLDDFSLIGESGRLRIKSSHRVNVEFLRYHRQCFYEEEGF